MRATNGPPRRGFTLIELLAGMTVMILVAGAATAMIVMLLRLTESGQNHAENEARIARAARLFREDVRSAATVEAGADRKHAAFLILSGPGGWTVGYEAARNGAVRVETLGSVVISQEFLELPARSYPRFTRMTIESHPFVTMTLDRHPRGIDQGPAHAQVIEAPLGAAPEVTR